MKVIRTTNERRQFAPIVHTRQAQAAMMTLSPGGASDDRASNEHPLSEQWVFVLAGRGAAIGNSRAGRSQRLALRPGTLLLIKRGEPHRIVNVGKSLLRTINVYVPPAYRRDGSVRPSARRPSRAR
jgi:oxalate decarboxylase/phosphoglucose isomerase-like protein (cupin superfamily)